jgi:hypothetical protein
MPNATSRLVDVRGAGSAAWIPSAVPAIVLLGGNVALGCERYQIVRRVSPARTA